jgi:bifunctional non-homologous end joining protein LigD
MGDRLDEYRRKRDAARTPEPVPASPPARGRDDAFVIQQHHARRLHWDLRLERGGVLVSWAVPRGLPRDPGRNHLAVHTEDHPLEYLDFEGVIPAGEYGGGRMLVYDRGTYQTEKWRDDEVIVVFHGGRTRGRYVLFQTRGRDWMVHRMDPPEPSWTPVPEHPRPMLAVPAQRLPRPERDWAYEMRWAGLRALGSVAGGRLRLTSAAAATGPGGARPGPGPGGAGHRGAPGAEITDDYPRIKPLAEEMAPVEALLDGELVRIDRTTVYLVYDLLWLDGRATVDLPYRDRRELLDGLALAGAYWQTPPYFAGTGRDALAASREQGLSGVVAKRLDSPYRMGEVSRDWREVAPA